MAIIIISLLVLVPLALLGWDLAHRSRQRHAEEAAAATTPRPQTSLRPHGHRS